MKKNIQIGMISDKINELAKKILKHDAFETFKESELIHRIMFVHMMAEKMKQPKIEKCCTEWMETITK